MRFHNNIGLQACCRRYVLGRPQIDSRRDSSSPVSTSAAANLRAPVRDLGVRPSAFRSNSNNGWSLHHQRIMDHDFNVLC
jgi:hypothetical protein